MLTCLMCNIFESQMKNVSCCHPATQMLFVTHNLVTSNQTHIMLVNVITIRFCHVFTASLTHAVGF